MTEQKGFIVYKDIQAVINELNDEQVAQLFRGMVEYFNSGIDPGFSGVLKFVFIPIKQQMDRDAEKYEKRCEKNRDNINKRWKAARDNTTVYDGIRTYTNGTNTNTNTNTNTDTNKNKNTITNTTTTTNTNTNDVVVVCDENNIFYTDIWKSITPDDIDLIYESFPETASDLIQTVYEDVKAKRKIIEKPVQYILGYAKRTGWTDSGASYGNE